MTRMDDDPQRGRGAKPFRVKVSLTGSIAQVLNDYPDGAQIARELLQNSEDAGATKQWYLLDHRTHSSQSVYCKGMEQYMGPALLAGNDSLFKEKDFDSLQNFGNSGKKTDYEKIGQMGIGFNSVYHMTDCPSFLSYDQLVILEPHENILRHGGVQGDFVFEREGLDRYADQIKPFKAMDDLLDLSKPYNGTIFRLPLRTKAQAATSEISNRAYSTQQARDMLMMLKEDALECLLFLKHIEQIRIYERTDNSKEPVLLFGIEIENAEEIRAERTKFMERLKSYSDSSSTIQCSGLTLDSSIRPQFKITDEYGKETVETWQVTSMLGDMTKARQQMEKQYKCDTAGHRLIPWVGVASPVNSAIKIKDPRLFCFLPIGYNAPFPVHINGHFAVKPSRREIWTNQGNDISEQSNARIKAHWNEYMMTALVPKVYARFLENMGLDHGADYSLWPEKSNEGIPALFHGMQTRMLTEAVKERRKIFFIGPPSSKKAVAFEDCNVADQILGQSTLLVDILHQMTGVVVGVPDRILASIRMVADNMGLQERILNPARVRNLLLLSVDLFSKVSSSAAKCQTLEYCSGDHDIEAFEGLPLLPMANGTWVNFSKEARDSRFLVNDLEYEILGFSNTGIVRLNEPNFPYWIIQDPKYTSFLTHEMPHSVFVQKIHQSFANHYNEGISDFPSEKWISQLWRYLKTHQHLISHLEGLHLLRTTGSKLASLDKENPVLVFNGQDSQTASNLKETLDIMDHKLGYSVLAEGQSDLVSVAGKYLVNISSVPGVLSILFSVSASKLSTLDQSHGKVLSQYIQHHLSSGQQLSQDQQASLRKLPIFYGYKDSELKSFDALTMEHGPIWYICKDFSFSDLPWVPSGMTLFQQSQDLEIVLKKILEVPILKEHMYWVHLLPTLPKMPETEWDKIISAFALKFQSYSERYSFTSILQSLAFVCVGGPRSGTQTKRIRPQQVISSHLGNMYLQEEHYFPEGIYAKHPILTMLQSLGMTSSFHEELARERILTISGMWENEVPASDTHVTVVAAALFSRVQRLCSEQTLSQDLTNVIQSSRWIPGSISTNPFNFRLYTPKECRPSDDRILLGDMMPAVGISVPSPTLRKVFGWDQPPPLEKVLKRLSQLIESGSEKSGLLEKYLTAIYCDLLGRIYDPVALAIIKETVDHQKWILVNRELYATDCVAFSMPSFLAPESVQLPSSALDPLFRALGVPDSVEVGDLQRAIRELGVQYGDDMSLSEHHATRVIKILEHIAATSPNSKEIGDLKDLLILNRDLKLCRIDEIVYDDVNAGQESSDIWTDSREETYNKANSRISHHVATKLNITMLSTRYWHSKKDSDIQPWAQQEDIVDRIKNILNDYDPSTIFQEFLQNAEDAGATKCVFMLDDRSYESQSILCPEMAACQGPALIIYNDAEFTKDDFLALCKIGVGNKRGDFSKIGRHGLGFNSAYHFTDIPSVVSGTHIGFFDPHKAYLPKCRTSKGLMAEGGIRIDFRIFKGQTYADQMAPYKGLFGCDMETHFKGTIFRFPLRTMDIPAVPKIDMALGESAWTLGRIRRIISDWHQDAKIAMLFLKSLKTIDLQAQGDSFTVTKSDKTEGSMLETIQAQSLKKSTARIVSIRFTLNNDNKSNDQEWLVFQESYFPLYFPADIVDLAKDNRWTPHRGTAFPLRLSDSIAEPFHGRLFTHLPTPIKTETKFHLHGQFALLSSRKHLAGGSINTGDSQARWNDAMRKVLMPLHLVKAFSVLLEYVIANNPKKTVRDLEVAQAQYFAYLPILSTLEREGILDGAEFWKSTYRHSVFPCRGAGHRLIAKSASDSTFMNAQFLFLPQDVQQKVVQLLISRGKFICQCPSTPLSKVKDASKSQFSEVAAALVRDCLSGQTNFLHTEIKSKEGQSRLLEYILEDILRSDVDIYPSISDLAIIPLGGGEWKSPSSTEATYYTAKSTMRALIKGNGSLISESLFNTETLKSILGKLVKDRRSNLQELELAPGHFAVIFCKENPGPLSDLLVERVWSFLHNYPDLSPFVSLQVLKPLWSSSLKSLSSARTGLMLDSNHVSSDILGLKRLILEQDVAIFPPSSYRNHLWVSRHHQTCGPVSVLKALYRTQGWERTFTFTTDEARILRGWLMGFEFSAHSQAFLQFLGQFRIWESYSSDPGAPLISAVGSVFPVATGKAELSVCGSFPNIIKYPGFKECPARGILHQLGARCLHAKDILVSKVVPFLAFMPGGLTLKQKTTYTNILAALWEDGMLDSEENKHASFLSSAVLIPMRTGFFAKGSDLFRPEDGLLRDFFDDEQGKFPDETIWKELRKLGRGDVFGLQTSDDDSVVRKCAEKLLRKVDQLPVNQRTLSPTMTASIGSPDLYHLAVRLVKHIYSQSTYQESMPGSTDWSDRKWKIVPAELTTDQFQKSSAVSGLSTFMSFSDLRCRLWRDLTWTKCAYYPANLEMPEHFRKAHKIFGNATVRDCVLHLYNLVVLAPDCKTKDEKTTFTRMLFQSYAKFEKCDTTILKAIREQCSTALADVAFILNGEHLDPAVKASWRKPSELMLDIEFDMNDQQPVHPSLLAYRTFLRIVGVQEIKEVVGDHSVKVPKGRDVGGALERALTESFEKQESVTGFMDVKFTFSDPGSGFGNATKSVLAHKFVLAHTSKHFLDRFTGLWAKLTPNDPEDPRLAVVNMPRVTKPEEGYDVFWGILYYLYTDTLIRTNGPPSATALPEGVNEYNDEYAAGNRVQYLVDLLKATAHYRVERLQSLIAAALMPPKSLITPVNALDIRETARVVEQSDLTAYCTAFIHKNRDTFENYVRDGIQRCDEEIEHIKGKQHDPADRERLKELEGERLNFLDHLRELAGVVVLEESEGL